jgi:spermidine/putrescine transport system permease protein
VFTPALGEFVIPDLLGGARTMLIGNLITEQFLKTRDWPFGSALSLLLVLVVMLSVGFFLSFQGRDEETPVSHET